MDDDATFPLPVFGVIGPPNSGKTTLLCAVIAELSAAGWRVGVIKQAAARFDLDYPGKDSFELRRAGLRHTLLASERRAAWITEHPEETSPTLAALLGQLDWRRLDVVLVEGFADAACAKLEVVPQGQRPRRYPADDRVIALVTAAPTPDAFPAAPAVLDLDQPTAVTAFIAGRCRGLAPDC
ncbi:MAG: molybdopterin-guanine dinucleotide biosynthesis protein B [Candidatus Competibacterales bacterium]